MLELVPYIILTTIASGAIIGFFLGTFGGGGSVLAAPLLIYIVGVQDPHLAIGTSAAAVAAIALVNLLGHWRGGMIKWPCAIVFSLCGLIGSVAGSSLAKLVSGDLLLLGFSVAMALIALSMFQRPRSVGDTEVVLDSSITLKLIPIGLIVGVSAGFFGIGGGFLIVPGLMLATGMTMGNATASSLLSVTIFGAATSMNYAVSGWVDIKLVVLLLIGGALGGAVGIVTSRRLSQNARLARSLFAVMILFVAVYIAVQSSAKLVSLL